MPAFGQLQTQIQIGFEDVGLRRHGFAIRRDRIVELSEAVLDKPEVKPRHVIGGIVFHNFPQQGFRCGVIVLLNGVFRLRHFRRRRAFFGNPCVTNRLTGVRTSFLMHGFLIDSPARSRAGRLRLRRFCLGCSRGLSGGVKTEPGNQCQDNRSRQSTSAHWNAGCHCRSGYAQDICPCRNQAV